MLDGLGAPSAVLTAAPAAAAMATTITSGIVQRADDRRRER